MSDPGLVSGNMTPEQFQEFQSQQRQMALARSLMTTSANPNTANSGLANAGNSILGAVTYNNAMQKAQDPNRATFATRYGMTPEQIQSAASPSLGVRIGNLFGLGGS